MTQLPGDRAQHETYMREAIKMVSDSSYASDPRVTLLRLPLNHHDEDQAVETD